jgi:predicted MPP superfamily phosphohydrolase
MRILQISDIHFASERDGRLDLNRELEWRFKEALEEAMNDRDFDAIFVSGDVAFGGAPDEYLRATNFLRDVCSLTGVGPEMVFVIPGNHDIDRGLTDTAAQRAMRSGLRLATNEHQADAALATALEEHGTVLMAPLEAFQNFAEQYDCPTMAEQPWWDRSLILDDHYELSVRGINSVLVSHKHDNKADEALVIGTAQVLLEPKRDRLHIVLCHHPREWVRWPRGIATRLDRDAALQITGHTHDYKLESTEGGAWLRAGALQPSRKEKRWQPHFAVVDIGVGVGTISIDITPWAWDSLKFEKQQTGHAQARAPSLVLSVERRAELTFAAAVRRLTVRLASLAPAEILSASIDADMPPLNGNIDDAPGRLARLAILAASTNPASLAKLWAQVDAARGVIEENPF